MAKKSIRRFDTGATRNDDTNQYEYAGFWSPLVFQKFAEYMHRHRKQADGSVRSSRNWRKGMPKEAYEESLLRHVVDVWLIAEGFVPEAREDIITALCGVIFNAQGMLHETLLEDKGLDRGRAE